MYLLTLVKSILCKWFINMFHEDPKKKLCTWLRLLKYHLQNIYIWLRLFAPKMIQLWTSNLRFFTRIHIGSLNRKKWPLVFGHKHFPSSKYEGLFRISDQSSKRINLSFHENVSWFFFLLHYWIIYTYILLNYVCAKMHNDMMSRLKNNHHLS